MSVEIENPEDQAGRPDLSAAMKLALPLLWDRLVPKAHRVSADALPAAFNLVTRIIPGEESTFLEFNRHAVIHLLQNSGIPYLVTAPRFQLVIRMRNAAGLSMPQSQVMLAQYVQKVAVRWGVELVDKAPSLILNWQFLDDGRRAMLSVRSNTRLPEYTETRELPAGDPVEQLQAWLEEILLKARDAYAFAESSTDSENSTGQLPDDDLHTQIHIQRSLSLSELVALEEALRHDPRVRSLVPASYSKQLQVYNLILKGQDASWLSDWFLRRGFRLTSSDTGWVVQ